tara:strand:- start:235 stop:897 length:663 start_codon:yes stop_codon:yes gene_type:complete
MTAIDRMVSLIVFDGFTEAEVAVELGLKKKQVVVELSSVAGQKQLELALDKKISIVSRLPMANFATRMRRLETVYQNSFGATDENGENHNDHATQLKTLSMAREEMRVRDGLLEQNNTPQIIVNVANFKGRKIQTDASRAVEAESGHGDARKPQEISPSSGDSTSSSDRSKVEGSETVSKLPHDKVSATLEDGTMVSLSRRAPVFGHANQSGPSSSGHME